jgi:hypothetical protein
MLTLRCLAAAGLVTLSLQTAQACDDFDEEMALAAAREAVQLAEARRAADRKTAEAPAQAASEVAAMAPRAVNDGPAPLAR